MSHNDKEEGVMVIASEFDNIPLFGRDGKYMVGLNKDHAYRLEDEGKIIIVEGRAHQV